MVIKFIFQRGEIIKIINMSNITLIVVSVSIHFQLIAFNLRSKDIGLLSNSKLLRFRRFLKNAVEISAFHHETSAQVLPSHSGIMKVGK